MKKCRLPLLVALIALLAAPPLLLCDGTGGDDPAQLREAASTVFQHSATAANTAGNCTCIDNSATNGKPGAILQVTHTYGHYGVFNNSQISVAYAAGKWCICNQEAQPVPEHAQFNVKVLSPGRKVFIHTVPRSTRRTGYTVIDNAATNGKSTAILQVTNASGRSSRTDMHPFGVAFDTSLRKWLIFHEDRTGFVSRATYNVEVLRADSANFIHVASAGNVSHYATQIDHPSCNGNPYAVLLITQRLANLHSGVRNDEVIGVWYDYALERWAIFNENWEDMLPGAAFNVSVMPMGP